MSANATKMSAPTVVNKLTVSTRSPPKPFDWVTVMKSNPKFEDAYNAGLKLHFDEIKQAVAAHKFSDIEDILRFFWGGVTPDHRQLLAANSICSVVSKTDTEYYETLLSQLIPDVFVLMDPSTPKQIRSFAKHCDSWLRKALDGFPQVFVLAKLTASVAFGQKLRRYTGLNHLVQAAREVLKNPVHVERMQQDYEKVDFGAVQEQLMHMCHGCSRETIARHEEKFREFQQSNCTITRWASWLQGIVEECMGKFDNEKDFSERGSQLLLRWSLISSFIIRDLTLRSAASFGPFHLMRLLCDEYMYFLVEAAMRAKACHPIKHESLKNDVPAIIIRAPTVAVTDAITRWFHATFEPVKASAAQVDVKRQYLAHCKVTQIDPVTESQLSKMLHIAFPGCYGDAGHFQGIRVRPVQPMPGQSSASSSIKTEFQPAYRPLTTSINSSMATSQPYHPSNTLRSVPMAASVPLNTPMSAPMPTPSKRPSDGPGTPVDAAKRSRQT
eukprot:m.43804 g.43804  ORF g.43804 m.43804 type:complete len:498 (+) comp19498_c0_seq1:191-1684(+)